MLNNLGGTLRAWAGATEAREALDEAAQAYRDALGSVAATERGEVLTNLGSALLDCYDLTMQPGELDEAIASLTGVCGGDRRGLT